jgi:hypothetical protein
MTRRPRTAGLQPAVLRISNPQALSRGHGVRLEVGDTAGWKPALRRRACYWAANPTSAALTTVLVRLYLSARFNVGEEIEDLCLRQAVEQTNGHK